MSDLKVGKKKGLHTTAKKFEKLWRQPVSPRIADFLVNEGRKEQLHNNTKKKIARPSNRQ